MSDFDRGNYDRIAYSIDPALIYEAINEICEDDLSNPSEFPFNINDSNLEDVIKQFSWVYHQVNA